MIGSDLFTVLYYAAVSCEARP